MRCESEDHSKNWYGVLFSLRTARMNTGSAYERFRMAEQGTEMKFRSSCTFRCSDQHLRTAGIVISRGRCSHSGAIDCSYAVACLG
jgi:hypothetical protein